jgi:hypothetical protein
MRSKRDSFFPAQVSSKGGRKGASRRVVGPRKMVFPFTKMIEMDSKRNEIEIK